MANPVWSTKTFKYNKWLKHLKELEMEAAADSVRMPLTPRRGISPANASQSNHQRGGAQPSAAEQHRIRRSDGEHISGLLTRFDMICYLRRMGYILGNVSGNVGSVIRSRLEQQAHKYGSLWICVNDTRSYST